MPKLIPRELVKPLDLKEDRIFIMCASPLEKAKCLELLEQQGYKNFREGEIYPHLLIICVWLKDKEYQIISKVSDKTPGSRVTGKEFVLYYQ